MDVPQATSAQRSSSPTAAGRITTPGAADFERQRHIAVLFGDAALVLLVVAALAASITASWAVLSPGQLAGLVVPALLFVAWLLYGARGIDDYWRQEQAGSRKTGLLGTRWGMLAFFTVQLALAATMYYFAASTGDLRFLWLVLLPPVSHAVMLLPPLGAMLVSVLSTTILGVGVVYSVGWPSLPNALAQFSLALAFTFVFTQIAVSAEKGRAEAARLANELADAYRRLGEYAIQAEELAGTRERNRLAREIHDSVGHALTAINVQLSAAQAMLPHDPAASAEATAKAQWLTKQGLTEIRNSVAALRVSPLDDRPLAEAIEQLIEASRADGVVTSLVVAGQPRIVPPPTALSLYRAAQEGLTNVRKHSSANTVSVVLDFSSQQTVRLRVQDDGRGTDDVADGFGLLGLRERALLLGGEVRLHSSASQGFTLEMELPG